MHDLAEKYFANIRKHRLDDLIALYAQDATLTLPDGRELTGVAAIRGMYRELFVAQSPSPRPVNVVAGEGCVAAEIEILMPDGAVRRTANFFDLADGGLIKRLSIYARNG